LADLKVKTALISVTDKSGLEDFAKKLQDCGVGLVSTGGTAKALEKAGLKVVQVEELTGFPEMLDGRVKTLHPNIHAGILADRNKKEHMQTLEKHNITPIDLVVVNLYPFKETIAKKGVSLDDAIENIDIGGQTMVRAAAKNFESVAVVTSPEQYDSIIKELEKNNGQIFLEKRKELAARAFELTASYDANVSGFLHSKFLQAENFPAKLTLSFEKAQNLRYGENWHQKASFYRMPLAVGPVIGNARQLHGKDLSFNNINDADAAIGLAKEFSEPAAVIIKHTNPCGTAIRKSLSEAFEKALDCDKTSAFGSVIALNRECDEKTAKQIVSFFNEIVVAPSFEEKALEILKQKKNLRVLELPGLGKEKSGQGLAFKFVEAGLLAQTADQVVLNKEECKVVTERKPSEQEMEDLAFAFAVSKHAKSNTIVLAKGLATVGVGAGQMSRIDATEIAVKKSNGRHAGSVLASDAFFPFRDNVDIAAKAGIKAIIQPGGSVRDQEVIEAANQHKIAMLFTGVRHFRH